MNNKLRLRTKLELEDRKKGFLEIVNILKSNNIFFFLQGGVLLGAVRNNSFIQWDWDVEISLFSDEFFEKRDASYSLISNNVRSTMASKKNAELTSTRLLSEEIYKRVLVFLSSNQI